MPTTETVGNKCSPRPTCNGKSQIPFSSRRIFQGSCFQEIVLCGVVVDVAIGAQVFQAAGAGSPNALGEPVAVSDARANAPKAPEGVTEAVSLKAGEVCCAVARPAPGSASRKATTTDDWNSLTEARGSLRRLALPNTRPRFRTREL